jgi:hypothetical protein
MSAHQVVWMDHKEARVFGVEGGKLDESKIHAPTHHLHRHPKGATEGKNHPDDMVHFFRDLAKTLEGAGQILLVGPSTAKLQFFRYAHKHDHALEARIVGLETVDHPTDGQLVAFAKHYFEMPDPRVT